MNEDVMLLVRMTALAIAVVVADTAAVTHAVETAKVQAMPLAVADATLAKTFAGDAQADVKVLAAVVALQHPQDDFHFGWEVQNQ